MSFPSSFKKISFVSCAILALTLSIWLRTPFLREGSPYIYREDEAHHFNRVLNMMKSGDLNPHYFHKPSLHFYLRLPIAAAGFLWSKQKGEVKSLKDLVTTDPYGIAGYSFSASPVRLLIASRAFSLLLQLASIVLTFLICHLLVKDKYLSLLAALIFACSPAAISESCVIGVDVVMTFFALLSTYLAMRALELKTTRAVFWCAVSAGLAVSSKYNALPVACLPFLVFLNFKTKKLGVALVALLVPGFAFLAASPFILVSFSEFWSQLSYEVWHYAFAGHIGHMAQPGIPQVIFYSKWLAHDGMGLAAASLALCGIIITCFELRNPKLLAFFAFPVSYFIMMALQKANFERNMTVIIPFFAMFAVLALAKLQNLCWPKIIPLAAMVVLIQPTLLASKLRSYTQEIPESRKLATPQLTSIARQGHEVVADGYLQFPRSFLEVPSISRVDLANISAANVFEQGYEYIAVRSSYTDKFLENNFFEEFLHFDGELTPQRLIQNPAIDILKRRSTISPQQIEVLSQSAVPHLLSFSNSASEVSFANEPETQIWLNKTVEFLIVEQEKSSEKDGILAKNLFLNLFSPWPNQTVVVFNGSDSKELLLEAGESKELQISLNASQKQHLIVVKSSSVHSPIALGISSDARKLAVAIKHARIS